jgi:hypothetical protein
MIIRTFWQCTALVGLLIVAILLGSSPASAQGDPYESGSTGYDVSYPQCGSVTPTGSFGIVGVNGGRPFSYNPCLAAEYSSAPTSPAPSLYINTGFSGAYRRHITANCSNLSVSVAGTKAQRQAWAIGCTEAEGSLAYAGQQGATTVSMWWIDVEAANSWSSSDLSLNQFTIQGAASRLAQTGSPVGVYSNAAMWQTITGGNFTPTGIDADWVTSGGTCSTMGFTASPVWLVQSTAGSIDHDLAC